MSFFSHLQDHDSISSALLKVVVTLTGATFGFLASHGQAIIWTLTGVYTAFNLYFLLRDKWWRDPARRSKRRSKRRSAQ